MRHSPHQGCLRQPPARPPPPPDPQRSHQGQTGNPHHPHHRRQEGAPQAIQTTPLKEKTDQDTVIFGQDYTVRHGYYLGIYAGSGWKN